jgi:hypothetical protein
MERYCSTGQSPQRAAAPTEEEEVCGRSRKLLLLHNFQRGSGTHPLSYSMDAESLFLLKQPGPEADHSLKTSAELTQTWSYTSIIHTSSFMMLS